MLFIPGKTTIQVSGSVQGLRITPHSAREICFNHQSEALPRFYVISVEFFLINLGQSQLWVCQTNQNSLNTANSRTTYLLMVRNPFPRSFDGKDFVAVKIHVKVSYFSQVV